jgi:hypothetical protein
LSGAADCYVVKGETVSREDDAKIARWVNPEGCAPEFILSGKWDYLNYTTCDQTAASLLQVLVKRGYHFTINSEVAVCNSVYRISVIDCFGVAVARACMDTIYEAITRAVLQIINKGAETT